MCTIVYFEGKVTFSISHILFCNFIRNRSEFQSFKRCLKRGGVVPLLEVLEKFVFCVLNLFLFCFGLQIMYNNKFQEYYGNKTHIYN